MAWGPVTDIGLVAGLNAAADANVLIYLPGVRLAWEVPGFVFLSTDFMARFDDSTGTLESDPQSAPKEGDSWMIDMSFATKTLELGSSKWNIEGHIEYVAKRDGEFGDIPEWVLAQPQVRVDLGDLLGMEEKTLFAGIEYQYWMNKLGDKGTDESAVQALLVWRL